MSLFAGRLQGDRDALAHALRTMRAIKHEMQRSLIRGVRLRADMDETLIEIDRLMRRNIARL